MKYIFYLLLSASIIYYFIPEKVIHRENGIVIKIAPVQTAAKNSTPFAIKEYKVTPMADFELYAVVLSKDKYWIGDESDLSTYDLTFGWQEMSDQANIDKAQITHGNRFYYYKYINTIPNQRMVETSANMHIISSNPKIDSTLAKVRIGDIVHLKGQLVRVDRPDGWHWVSSMVRTDTKGGACELVYTQELEILTNSLPN